MANISNTVLGTSDPVNLCQGFALFPALGDVRAGIQTGGQSQSLFSVAPQFLMWKFNANANYGIFMGVCGPSYGFKFNASGSTNNGTLTLSVNDDVAAGGFLVGLNINFTANITVQRLGIKWVWDGWNSHIATTWETAFNVSPSFGIDVIGLILAVILYINDEQSEGNKNQLMSKVNSFAPNLLGSWGFFDQQSDQIVNNAGEMDFEPALLIPINLANLVPQLVEVNKGLAVLWGGFGFGPQFGISIPTQVKVDSFSVDSSTYSNLTWSGSTVTGTGGTEIAAPTTLGAKVTHTPDFDIQLGGWAQFYLLKLFEVGFSTSFDLLNLLGIKVQLGSYDNNVSSPIGGGPNAGRVAGAFAHEAEAERFEVILAPPALAV